jgi:hypothetical protein
VDFFPPWLGSQYPFILNNKLGRPKGKINDHQFLVGNARLPRCPWVFFLAKFKWLAFFFPHFQNGEKICFFCFVL